MEIPKKNKNRTTILTSNSTPGYLYKEDKKKLIQKDICTQTVRAALFTMAKIQFSSVT